MNKIKKTIALLAWLPALAMAQVELSTQTYKVTEVIKADGSSKIEWVTADSIVPGDKVGYRIIVNNNGTEPADSIVLDNPVPQHTVYVAGSARGANSKIEYSVDSGKSYNMPEKLFITKNGKKYPATAKDYSHVKWTLTHALKAGESTQVQYVVQVK